MSTFKIADGNAGLCVPSKTTVEKNAIVAPETGLILYDSNLASIQTYGAKNLGAHANVIPTNFVLSGNVVTCTCVNSFSTGSIITVYNINAAGFTVILQGKTFTVSTANGTSFTFPYVNADVASAANTNGYIQYRYEYTTAPIFNAISASGIQQFFLDDFTMYNTQQWTATPGTISLENAGAYLAGSNTINNVISWTSPFSFPIGNYFVNFTHIKFNNRGIYDVAVSCNGGGYTNIALGINGYSNGVALAATIPIYFSVTAAGTIILRFTVISKHTTSTGYILSFGSPFTIYRIG